MVEEDVTLNNCWRLKTTGPKKMFVQTFSFVDYQCPDGRFQGIKRVTDVGIKSFKPIFAGELTLGKNYFIVHCLVKNKEVDQFLQAMYRLEKDMYIMGNNDYDEVCDTIFSTLTS